MSRLTDQVGQLRHQMEDLHLQPELELRVLSQLEEIERMEGDIASRVHIEQMLRYIDWILNLPWNKRTEDILDLNRAKEVLEKHHYGLQPVKDRILEYLAVLKFN